ncbi:putative acyl-CoA dehydrogenase [Pseudoclavibacter triregionum]|nr:putative acyl-CoA dehydrogenase [Pseudoclavibacter triregionum]
MADQKISDPELDAPLALDSSRIDVDALSKQLLGTWAEARLRSRKNASRPELHRDDTLPYMEHRARVLGQLKLLVEEGAVNRAFPKRLGGEDDHGGNIAAFEELVLADPSMQIKAGVQWGLFGAAVLHLGTEYHHDTFLPGIMTLEVPGVYAMTEQGHGSDVASIGTTATYDEAAQEWVINTPFRGAWKDYLGNAALHGKAAVVFAQLITKGVNHGVHAFYVPIRDDEGQFLPGIQGEDDGVKGGLNGIDNGRLCFTDVRVPRRNLLNRYGDVAEDGTYTSPIESPGRRFFTMLGTLVQGRVSLDGAATAASKAALQIAVTYGNQRRQFSSATPHEETVLMDYQLHQRRLIPHIATTYAQAFAHENFLRQFHGVFSGELDTPENREDLETLAAALKPLSTWKALEVLQECREACGGAGFLAENRFPQLRYDLDIYTTFEGDNNVLLQLVGKRLLTDYSAQFKGLDQRQAAGKIAGQVADRIFHGSGLRQIGQTVLDFGQAGRSVGWLRNPATQHELLATRVETMIADIASRMRNAKKLSPAEAAALFNDNQHELIEAARAHGELLQWEAFTDALGEIRDIPTKRIMTWLRDLFGLRLIEQHLEWHLLNGRISPQRGALVSKYINRLLARLRPHAQDLVDAFGYGPELLRAQIATGAEQRRQDEAREYYKAQRESGEAPVSEAARYKAEQKAKRKASGEEVGRSATHGGQAARMADRASSEQAARAATERTDRSDSEAAQGR